MAARPPGHTGRAAKTELICAKLGAPAHPEMGRDFRSSWPGAPYGLYAGSFGRKQDLALLIELPSLLSGAQGPPRSSFWGTVQERDVLKEAGSEIVWLDWWDEAVYAAVLGHALAGIVALAPGVGGLGRAVQARIVPRRRGGLLSWPADVDSESRSRGGARCVRYPHWTGASRFAG